MADRSKSLLYGYAVFVATVAIIVLLDMFGAGEPDPLMPQAAASGSLLSAFALPLTLAFFGSLIALIIGASKEFQESGFKGFLFSAVFPTILVFVGETMLTQKGLGHMGSLSTFIFSSGIFLFGSLFKGKKSLFDTGKGDIGLAGSRLNPKNLLAGSKWTTPKELQTLFAKTERRKLYINHFRYYDDTKSALKIPTHKLHRNEDTAVYFEPIKTCETLLFLGGMGSGKTTAILSIATQPHWSRQIFHDPQGEFRRLLVPQDGSTNDIIFSPYDKDGQVWDIFSDMTTYGDAIATSFVSEMFSSIVKQTSDSFWNERGTQIVSEIVVDVWMNGQLTTPAQKWLECAQKLKYKSDAMGEKGGTEGSLGQTMQVIVDSVYVTAWKAQMPTTKFFTINNFMSRKDGQKIILANSTKNKKKLSPLFAGFMGVFVGIGTSLPNIDRNAINPDITLVVLDEIFKLGMSNDALDVLLTLGRKKGLAVIPAAQALPTDNQELLRIVESSAYAQFIFRVTHKDTLERVVKGFDEVEFTKEELSTSNSTNNAGQILPQIQRGKSTSSSIKEKKEKFLTVDHVSNMPEYHCLTIMRGVIYLGQVDSRVFAGLPDIGVEENLLDTKEFFVFRRELEGKAVPTAEKANSSDEILDEIIEEVVVNLEEVKSDG